MLQCCCYRVFVYLVVSGQLGEVRVGEGVAKFKSVSAEQVEVTDEALDASMEEITIFDKDGSHVLPERLMALSESTPLVMAWTMGKKDYYK